MTLSGTAGPYARIRYPQYVAFALILPGFLPQWSTLLTLPMFPALLLMYGRLAVTDGESDAPAVGEVYDDYACRTPRFIPNFDGKSAA